MKLINGDCLEEMKNIPDGSVDMILADPPYGTTACKWDSIIPLGPMWEQLYRALRPNGFIGIELDKDHFDIAVDRIEKA